MLAPGLECEQRAERGQGDPDGSFDHGRRNCVQRDAEAEVDPHTEQHPSTTATTATAGMRVASGNGRNAHEGQGRNAAGQAQAVR